MITRFRNLRVKNFFLQMGIYKIIGSGLPFPKNAIFTLLVILAGVTIVPLTAANRPPQFLLSEGQSEIVLRLKEGKATPVGSLIYRLKGVDFDDDPLTFGLRGQIANELLRIENLGTDEANVYLKKELDRELEDEYMLVLTLTDGRLSEGSFVTQSLLLLIIDINDNTPVFLPFQSTISVPENSQALPQVISTFEATDRDEGPYGQVVYRLQTEPGDENVFSVSTSNGQGVLKLLKPLDYEKKFLYQLQVLAVDRANTGQINTATAAVVVQVEDLEDSPPVFVSVQPVARLREDVPRGTFVLQVRAIDGDRGVQNEIKYSLLNENELFGVDSISGIVYTKGLLDREDPNGGSYILQIVATEQTKSPNKPHVSTEVTILLEDVNDETPECRSKSYIAEILENSPADAPVTFLGDSIPECFDHDLGVNGTFRLYAQDDGGVFEVTPSQGINQVSFLIRVKNPSRLDFEKLKVINFTLVVEELDGEKSSLIPFQVFIKDANDNSPIFQKDIYEFSVSENSPAGTKLAQVRATDKDSGLFGTDGIRYTSLTGSIAGELNLDPISGIISVKQSENSSLDRELSPVYYLTVEARDNAGRGNRNTVQLLLILLDVNDNAPIWSVSRYEGRVFENEFEFVSPLRLQAFDADLPNSPNSEVHYSIVDGNEGKHFVIEKLSGIVRIATPVDFESMPTMRHSNRSNVKRINFTARANDMGTPPRFTLAAVTIFVHDTNDHSPIFAKSSYDRIIREDTATGTQILKVEATDGDGSLPFNRVFYRIERGAEDKFIIDPETGIIRLAPGAVLDYNIKTSHTLEVFALDGGGQRSEIPAVVHINISDVNTKPPRFIFNDVESDETGEVYHAKILENSPKGTYITQVRAFDPDHKPLLRFGIDFNKSEARSELGRILKGVQLSSSLELQPVDGILKVIGEIDREKMEVVKLALTVEDLAAETGRQIATATLLLKVEDVNDNDPKFSKNPYIASVPENSKIGTGILVVLAEDADLERTIRYTLIPRVDDVERHAFPLEIDPDTGVIEVVSKIDREFREWVNFTIMAEDSGTVPRKRSSEVDVYISISDENDNNPVWISEFTNLTVKEDAPVGKIVGKLEAEDKDKGENGKITYLLDRKSSKGKFTIDPDTGVIRVAEALDREETPSFSLVVQAWDNYRYGYSAGDSRNAFKQITVILEDINDSSPRFLKTEAELGIGCFSITEFHEDIVTTVQAIDNDDPATPNARISFKIRSGNALNLFKLEQGKNSAKVLPARSLKGFYGNYTLVIEAQDGGVPPNVATNDLMICISDYNDHPPRFINFQNFTIRIPENATIGTTLTQVRAVDNDIGQNGVVRYRFRQDISGHWETFSINPTTGVISLAKLLDREVQKLYHIRVEAHDLGSPTPLSSDLDLTIYVKNVDDFKPQFMVDTFMVNFTENLPEGKESVQLPNTLDRDDIDEEEQESLQVCYFIVPDEKNSTGLFKVDPIRHLISSKYKLDREKQQNYTLQISATEDCVREGKNFGRSASKASSLLKVIISVSDVNDNAPVFAKKTFTGGVSTATDYGTEFMKVKAFDADAPPNNKLKYYIIHPITLSLSEGLGHLVNNDNPLFSIDANTGAISLAFDPQPDMKGHFIINVGVNDTFGLSDKAKALVYLLREDQKVRVVVRMNPSEVRQHVDYFTRVLSNVTGVVANVDENFKFHENRDGSVDKTKTDFFIHLVHPERNIVLEVDQVLKLIDLNIEELDDLFKEFNVVDTQASKLTLIARKGSEESRNLFLVYASGSALFLIIVLFVVITLCFAQRAKFRRRLKAATANAYGSNSTIIPRTGNVPNTNVHSGEGSNPIWMQAYHNNWYKEDSLSENSEARDSLEEQHAIGTESASPPSSHMRSFVGSDREARRNDLNRTFHKNLLYNNRMDTNSTCLILKKHLETTEL